MRLQHIVSSSWAMILRVSIQLLLVSTIAPGLLGVRTYSEQQTKTGWRNTGVTLPSNALDENMICFDATQPNVILLPDAKGGATTFNWATGVKREISDLPYRSCAIDDQRRIGLGLGSERTAGWFKILRDPSPDEPKVYYTAQDGTQQIYSLQDGILSVSSDGGTNWQERRQQFGRSLSGIAVSAVDANSIYALTTEPMTVEGETSYSIHFSGDAGITWEKRYDGKESGFGASPAIMVIEAVPNAPTNVVLMKINIGGGASGGHTDYLLSGNGARTFQTIGTLSDSELVQVIHTQEGLLRLIHKSYSNSPPQITLSTDSGQNWQPLKAPDGFLERSARIAVSRVAPNDVFISQGSGPLWYSPDGGHNWQQFEDYTSNGSEPPTAIQISPYLPLTLLGVHDSQLYVLEPANAGKSLSTVAKPHGATESIYFRETGHNLSGIFKGYWDAHGGLPQQGYPITETFREVSDTDGKVYLVQYFERAVFEYHPEKAPPDDVLLSLLGSYLYRQKYPNGAPNQTANTGTDSLFFTTTGKRLGGKFLEYWNAHGGLRQQGYPISDEFQEKSEVDGRTYTVQYFERAVFEFHPENAGTPYDVLLSHLGTFHFDSKYDMGF